MTEHTSVLMEADAIFNEKNPVRGDLWRAFPPSDKLRELRERLMRMEGAYVNRERQHHANLDQHLIEDALDSINFCVFFIRQIREGATG